MTDALGYMNECMEMALLLSLNIWSGVEWDQSLGSSTIHDPGSRAFCMLHT